MTFVKTNIMNPMKREIVSTCSYENIIRFLLAHFKDGFKNHTDIYIDTKLIKVQNYDMTLKEDDIVVLIERPAGGDSSFFGNLIAFMVLPAVVGSIALVDWLKPDIPNFPGYQNNTASSIYNLNSSQNEVKLGQAIPVIYGTVRSYLAMIGEPYYRYENNEEYMYNLLCIGQGKYDLNKLLISEQDITNSRDVEYKKLEQSDFVSIEEAVDSRFYNQITTTLSNPSDLELIASDNLDVIVRFSELDKKITIYDVDDIDVSVGDVLLISKTLYNDGSYTIDTVTQFSDYAEIIVNEDLTNEPSISFNDTTTHTSNRWESQGGSTPLFEIPVGAKFETLGKIYEVTVQISYTDYFPSQYATHTNLNAPDTNGTITPISTKIKITTIHETEKYKLKQNLKFVEVDYRYPNGLYKVDNSGNYIDQTDTFEIVLYSGDENTILNVFTVQTTNDDNDELVKTFRVTMGNYDITDVDIWISFKKVTPKSDSNKVQNKIYVKRIKQLLHNEDNTDYGDISLLWVRVRATNAISSSGQFQINGYFRRNDVANDLKSILTDIYTNEKYGARLSPLDLSLDDTPGVFVNVAFDTNMTIYDAMKNIAKSQRYTLYPVGQNILLKYDDKKPITTGLYNETNILRGSLKMQYFFREDVSDTDGYECSYIEAENWDSSSVIYPLQALYPEKIPLAGVTDKKTAQTMAKYFYNKEKYRHKSITFDTDIQGLVPELLDKILVSHNTLNWGDAGEVLEISGNRLELSGSLIDITINKITFRNIDGSVSETFDYTKVDNFSVIIVGIIPAWVKVDTFYTVGKAYEFLVTNIKPKGNSVAIECTNYDERVYE